MKIENIRNNGFIVALTCSIFNVLRQVSLFQQVRNISLSVWNIRHKSDLQGLSDEQKRAFYNSHRPLTGTYLFPELWVVGNVVCGMIIYALMAGHVMPTWLGWVCVVLACLRAFEIMVYHVNVLLFDPLLAPQNTYAIKSATRMMLMLLINMLEYVLCFSIVYLFFMPETVDGSFWQSLEMSMSAFLNIGMPELDSSSRTLMVVVRIESVLGIFMNLICIARFINMLPSVKTIDNN